MARRGSSYLHANEPSRLVRGLTWVAPRRGAGRRFHSAGKFGAAVGAGPLLCLEPSLQRLNPLEHCPHGALHVLRSHVHLEIDGIADLLARQDDLGLGVRDKHEVEPAVGHIGVAHGEAGAVDGNEALGHDVRHEPRWRLDAYPERLAVGPHLLNHANIVHVALDKMARIASVGGESALQIHRRARWQLLQVGPPQSLGAEPCCERIAIKFGHRQADAVDRNAAAEVGAVQNGLRTDLKLPPFANAAIPEFESLFQLKAFHFTNLFYNPRKNSLW
mmetsp:Transcript_7356/g.14403  ORF Transcript_7356/g.14403 Transcript_7356/m.14403 type:complete len:275 (+) Transcript_7356:105-929(+)